MLGSYDLPGYTRPGLVSQGQDSWLDPLLGRCPQASQPRPAAGGEIDRYDEPVGARHSGEQSSCR